MYASRLADQAGNTSGPTVPTIWQIGSDGGLLDAPPPFNLPFFSTAGYRTDEYEAAWPPFVPSGFGSGTRYGDGPPLRYLSTTPMGGNPDVTPYLIGTTLAPDPNEAGYKDTLKMYPGTVTRLVLGFAPQDLHRCGVPGFLLTLYP